ncbi:MAG: hypothetical protein RIA08_12345 [Roseovarius sp.]|uniref:hypothetical protein n=1 Tax=Roseovarius sp. TaxID=1486281 RepID=UPI0032EB2D87
MRRVIKVFTTIALLAVAAPVAAEDATASNGTPFTRTDLYAAIEAGDHRLVETTFAELQAQTLANEVGVNRLRGLYGVFGTSNPRIVGFAESWLEAYPDSPFARTGLAWARSSTGWNIRGEKLARQTFPDALEAFSLLHRDAWDLAFAAHETDPALVPASDALLALANSTGEYERAFEVLDRAMTLRPDLGTLERATLMTAPGWGGKWDTAEALCDHYGPTIDPGKTDATLHCKVYAALNYHVGEMGEWGLDILERTPIPALDYLRIHMATSSSASRADAAFAHAYLTRDGFTDVRNARRFDENVAWQYGYDFLGESHLRQARKNAAEALEHDPYDPALNRIMAEDVMAFELQGDSLTHRVVERVPTEQKLLHVGRQLAVSPYDPELWTEYATLLRLVDRQGAMLKAEPYAINAIVYSNYSPGYVIGYAQRKARAIIELDSLEDQPDSAMWQRLSEADKARAEQDRQKLLDFRHGIDMDKTLRCPMLQAYRLHGVICARSNSSSCELHQTQRAMFEPLLDDIEKRRACTGVMAASEIELFFLPVDVELFDSEG